MRLLLLASIQHVCNLSPSRHSIFSFCRNIPLVSKRSREDTDYPYGHQYPDPAAGMFPCFFWGDLIGSSAPDWIMVFNHLSLPFIIKVSSVQETTHMTSLHYDIQPREMFMREWTLTAALSVTPSPKVSWSSWHNSAVSNLSFPRRNVGRPQAHL